MRCWSKIPSFGGLLVRFFCDDAEPAERRRKNKNFLQLQALRCHGTVCESHPKMSHFHSADSNLKRSEGGRLNEAFLFYFFVSYLVLPNETFWGNFQTVCVSSFTEKDKPLMNLRRKRGMLVREKLFQYALRLVRLLYWRREFKISFASPDSWPLKWMRRDEDASLLLHWLERSLIKDMLKWWHVFGSVGRTWPALLALLCWHLAHQCVTTLP